MANTAVYDQAINVLKHNDKGSYTTPSQGLYPFQWNWDSCLSALGLMHISEERAWLEIETLFEHQWADGMVPHIIFHEPNDNYFPGPEVWGTHKITSGITQPAVAGFVIKRLFDRAQNKPLAQQKALALLPKVSAWHQWFYTHRDPKNTGLVSIIHPWESGRDNSLDWDAALDRISVEGLPPYQRKDNQLVNPAERPTQAHYDRYLWLVKHFRGLNWDNQKLQPASPFQILDPGFNAILIRSCAEIAELAAKLQQTGLKNQNQALADTGMRALEKLWSAPDSQYLCYDQTINQAIHSLSVGGLIPIFAGISTQRVQTLVQRIKQLAQHAKFIIPSHDTQVEGFLPTCYWRGPAWLIVNYLIVDGLRLAEQHEMADRIMQSSLALIEQSGFAEYYDPQNGQPCGGQQFSWTAAMVLEFLSSS